MTIFETEDGRETGHPDAAYTREIRQKLREEKKKYEANLQNPYFRTLRSKVVGAVMLALLVLILVYLIFLVIPETASYFKTILGGPINALNPTIENIKSTISYMGGGIWSCVSRLSIRVEPNYKSTEADSKAAIDDINKLRQRYGKKAISFDKRLFELAVGRAIDMREFNYVDHTNPYTGTCPDSMKQIYGLNESEYVSEDAFGNLEYVEDFCTMIETRSMTDAINSWMGNRGQKYNLLYDGHVAGAVGCYKNVCVFLGLNPDSFGKGCRTMAEGRAFWGNRPEIPGESGPVNTSINIIAEFNVSTP